MVSLRVSELFQQDTRESGGLLKTSEREKLLLPYLPQESEAQSRKKHKPIRSFLKAQLHFVIYTAIHLCFSLYIRTRRTIRAVLHRVSAILYYHHRTPELIRRDVRGLARLPQHLSVVLTLPSGNDPRNLGGQDGGPEAVRALLDDVAELSAWCASAGIPLLSVYEATGVLTNFVPATHRAVADKLHAYFGARRPSLQVRTPHQPSFLNGDAEEREAVGEAGQDGTSTDIGHLSLLLLSADDGRSTLVDLTKTLAEMAQHGQLAPRDISQELLHDELTTSVMDEPDLLMVFSPVIQLQGYPPWQLRLTEIFHEEDRTGVEYLIWLKGLYNYAKAQMRFGR